jgi:branched-chain amino acid transport system permease protein
MLVIIFASVLSGISGVVGAWRIQFLDPTFGGVTNLIFGLTVAILAVKPKIQWIIGSSAFCLLLPEIIRFLPLPSSIFANVRALIYAVLLIVLIRWLSDKHTDHKRLV